MPRPKSSTLGPHFVHVESQPCLPDLAKIPPGLTDVPDGEEMVGATTLRYIPLHAPATKMAGS